MLLSPIALFTYKRPEHTRVTLESLIGNRGFEDSQLYVFSDGPRTKSDAEAVRETREVIRSYKLRNVEVIESEGNLGLASSIIGGVTKLCAQHARVIVVEDDLLLSPWFLTYMNEGLNRYEGEPRVMQISGHTLANYEDHPELAFLLPLTTTWGWATWKRAWQHFDSSASGVARLRADGELRRKFDLDGVYPYYEILSRQLAGRLDSWGIRWYLSVFMLEGLTLYPGKALVQNIGFDGSGENCSRMSRMGELAAPVQTRISEFPDRIQADEKAFGAVKKAIRDTNRWRWFSWR